MTKAVSKRDYLVMFFLLAVSGNPFFLENLQVFISIAAVISLVYVIMARPETTRISTIWIFVFFIGFEILHSLVYWLDYSLTVVKLIFVLWVGLTIVIYLGKRFVPALMGTMYFISLISLLFTVLCYVPGVGSSLYEVAQELFPLEGEEWKGTSPPTLLVYTFFPQFFEGSWSYVRNAGIFWESGAFAVFLNITLYLHYSTKPINRMADLFDKRSLVLIVTVLSTTSTMGFVGMSMILAFFSFQVRSAFKYAFLLSFAVAIVLSFTQVEYLGAKIVSQLVESSSSQNRFGSALLDLDDILKRPLLGWSRRPEVLFGNEAWTYESHRPNGLTNLARNYGLIYFVVYFAIIFMRFRQMTISPVPVTVAVFGIAVLWVSGFSEPIFDLAFLKCLLFLPTKESETAQSPESGETVPIS